MWLSDKQVHNLHPLNEFFPWVQCLTVVESRREQTVQFLVTPRFWTRVWLHFWFPERRRREIELQEWIVENLQVGVRSDVSIV